MTLEGSSEYRRLGYEKVQGWFWPEDYRLFDLILDQQLISGAEGDLLEIGCYHGKSAILMGYGLREGEQLIISDLFGAPCEDTAEVTDHFEDTFNQQTFVDNYAKFHTTPPEILAGSSLDLRPRLAGRRNVIRFAHVDGGHAQTVASFDIDTAVRNSMWQTVVAIDDYRTHHTPGVGAAIWAAAVSEDVGQIFPFALSENKVYAAVTPMGHDYWIGKFLDYQFPGSELHRIFGRNVLRLTEGKSCG